MGNGCTAQSPNSPTHRVKENSKIKLQNLEVFVTRVYMTCPRAQSLRAILSTSKGKHAFKQYIASISVSTTVNNLFLLELLEKLKKKDIKKQCKAMGPLLDMFVRSTCPKPTEITDSLREKLLLHDLADKNDPRYEHNVLAVLKGLEIDVLQNLASSNLAGFVNSAMYKRWRAAEVGHATAHTIEEHKDKLVQLEDISKRDSTLFESCHSFVFSAVDENEVIESDVSYSVRELAYNALGSIDPVEITRVMFSENWLRVLLSAVEALPVCFTVSTAHKDRPGFPLVYVNRFFENTTGYSRQACLGKSISMLESPLSDPASSLEISTALVNAQPCEAVVTNQLKDGRVQKMLMGIKPVFNDVNEYCYVFAMHIAVGAGEADSFEQKKRLVHHLLEYIPSVVVCGDIA